MLVNLSHIKLTGKFAIFFSNKIFIVGEGKVAQWGLDYLVALDSLMGSLRRL